MVQLIHVIGVVCLMFQLLVTAQAELNCPADWVVSEDLDICIKVSNSKLPWEEARAACQNEGADLVKILSQEVNDFVAETAGLYGDVAFWIGLNDLDNPGSFVWLDEETEPNWTNWRDNEPVDDNGANCVYMYLDDGSKWGDTQCASNYDYICGILDESSAVMTEEALTCPADWEASEESGSCIKASTETLSWYDARDACQTEGGDLVKIVNSDMNDFIANLLENIGGIDYWIGLHFDYENGYFVWLDESTEAEYQSWNSFHGDADHECVVTGWTSSALDEWGEYSCDLYNRYICEIFPDQEIASTAYYLETTFALTTTQEDVDIKTTTTTAPEDIEIITTTTSSADEDVDLKTTAATIAASKTTILEIETSPLSIQTTAFSDSDVQDGSFSASSDSTTSESRGLSPTLIIVMVVCAAILLLLLPVAYLYRRAHRRRGRWEVNVSFTNDAYAADGVATITGVPDPEMDTSTRDLAGPASLYMSNDGFGSMDNSELIPGDG